jgi:hypothetical protein
VGDTAVLTEGLSEEDFSQFFEITMVFGMITVANFAFREVSTRWESRLGFAEFLQRVTTIADITGMCSAGSFSFPEILLDGGV